VWLAVSIDDLHGIDRDNDPDYIDEDDAKSILAELKSLTFS
jgi:hypothetical protein